MIMKKLANIHPGEILDKEFLVPLNISAYRLSKEIKLPQTRISEIIKGKRRITADTALRLSKYFGNSPQFWLGLQNDYDLEEETNILKTELNKIHSYAELTNDNGKHAVMA
jgi:antitoxin HigA-1